MLVDSFIILMDVYRKGWLCPNFYAQLVNITASEEDDESYLETIRQQQHPEHILTEEEENEIRKIVRKR